MMAEQYDELWHMLLLSLLRSPSAHAQCRQLHSNSIHWQMGLQPLLSSLAEPDGARRNV